MEKSSTLLSKEYKINYRQYENKYIHSTHTIIALKLTIITNKVNICISIK